MKTLFLCIFLLVIIPITHAQQWVLQDGGNGDDFGTSIIADKYGNIYATGCFSMSATFGTTVLNSIGDNDAFLVKYDTSGNFIWAKRFGGSGMLCRNRIAIDNNDNIIITGEFEFSDSIQIGSLLFTTNNNFANSFVAKFDTTGNVIWANINEGYVLFNDIAIDSNNNINIIGTIGGHSVFGTDTIIPYYDASMGIAFNSPDIIIAQYSSSGLLNWVKKAGGHGKDYGNSITTDFENNIYITGAIDIIANFDTIIKNTTNGTYNLPDVFVAKLNTYGDFLSVKNYGGYSSNSKGEKIKFINNQLYFAGQFSNSIILDQDTLVDLDKTFISKTDTLFNFLWVKKTAGFNIFGMDIDHNKNIYFAGEFKGIAIFGTDTLTTFIDTEAYISKTDSNGLFIWSKQGGGKYFDCSFSLCLDPRDNAYITGYFSDTAKFGAFNLITVPYYLTDVFIAKYAFNETPNTVFEVSGNKSNIISLFPNPANGLFTIQSSKVISKVEIFNILGEKTFYLKTNSYNLEVDIRNQPRGIYLVHIILDDKSIIIKKLIIMD
jgi:hypothetical protein